MWISPADLEKMSMQNDLRTWQLALAGLVGVAFSYPLGYLLIDALGWVALSQDQARDGYVHVFRTLTGLLCLVLPMMAWMAWEAHSRNTQ